MAKQSNLKPIVAGAAIGALLTMVVGFTMGGWVTGSKAESVAQKQSNLAVISALAPICLSNFKAATDSTKQHALLEKTEDWKRADFIKQGGWAKVPGLKDASTGLANTCAKLILADK